MAQYSVVNESSEDTLHSTDSLQDAIQIAMATAKQGSVGDLVTVLEATGRAIRQFQRMPDGAVTEQPIRAHGSRARKAS